VIRYFDTPVVVAASVESHPRYAEAFIALKQAADKRHKPCISAHGLAEIFPVLTRAPFSPHVYPTEALQIIEQNVLPHFEVLSISAQEYQEVIRECAMHGWAGGRIYDALHLRFAQKRGCDRIYTLNLRDFRDLAPRNLQSKICEP
jgi:predicted nucleic acid-binding protein